MRTVRAMHNLTQAQFADILGVSRSAIGMYESMRSPVPADVAKRVQKQFPTAPPLPSTDDQDPTVLQNRQTGIYNSGVQVDSALEKALLDTAREIADLRTISVTATVGEGHQIWSAKGARKIIVNTYAFVAQGKELVQLADESLGKRFKSGTVLAFSKDSYPREDVFLLLQRRDAPDLRTIRYIDAAGDAQSLLSMDPSVPPEHLSDWTVEGYAYAEIMGDDVNIRRAGIGPRTK